MHILIAPNAFKSSLHGDKAAWSIERGLHRSKLACTTELLPVGDGGDGTGALLVKLLKADTIDVHVKDPLGKEIIASYGWLEESKLAIVEMADASGLRLLKPTEYDPLKATSFGTGQLIKAAIEKGASEILLCIGGSATVDGGMGILNALGVQFLDSKNNSLYYPSDLSRITDYNADQLVSISAKVKITVLCDVLNPLLGKDGSAAVFGPQKGATATIVKQLDTGLRNYKNVIAAKTGEDIGSIRHGGAAGGVAAGLYGLAKATLVNGIDEFLRLVEFEKAIQRADLVITGEGSIDRQTLHGKAPFGVAKMAKKYQLPVIAFAGRISDNEDGELKKYFDELIDINEKGTTLEEALRKTAYNLERSAFQFAETMQYRPLGS